MASMCGEIPGPAVEVEWATEVEGVFEKEVTELGVGRTALIATAAAAAEGALDCPMA